MALITCPECGRGNVSDSAEACPSCGYNIKHHFLELARKESLAKQKEANQKKLAEEMAQKELEEQIRSEENERLENEMQAFFNSSEYKDASRKNNNATVILLVCACALLFTLILFRKHSFLKVFLILIELFVGVGCIIAIRDANAVVRKYSKTNSSTSSMLQDSQYDYLTGATNTSLNNGLANIVCPLCGSNNTERISTASRVVSTYMVGLASAKIGKQYKCKNCKHMW